MTRIEKSELYDRICRTLTEFEDVKSTSDLADCVQESYSLLVEVQNKWDELINTEG